MNKKMIKIFLILLYLLSFSFSETINLSDYKYPENDNSSNYAYITIVATNDLHGGIFPIQYSDINSKKFLYGGGMHLYSYVKALREQWEGQFLWLDAGDQFTGTMECMLSDCTVMRDYYNKAGVDAIAIGNHDFDYGVDYLQEYIKKQSFPILAANVKLSTGIYLYELWENVLPYKIYTYTVKDGQEIKIGVIGLATKKTPSFTSADLSDLVFEDYFEVTKNWVEFLRNVQGVNAIVLLTHFGPMCKNDGDAKMELKMRTSSTEQKLCKDEEEIMYFLIKLKEEHVQVDAIVAGHSHDIVHHWISDIPVVQSSGSDYLNVLYLPFKLVKDVMTLQKNKIEIEGPVPVCEKLWPNTKNCIYKYEDSSIMQSFTFHKKLIELDEELANVLKFWNDIINEKVKNDIFETKDKMFVDSKQETLLVNLVNDVGRIITGSDICFFNFGGIRTTWYKGPINEIDLFRMFPFNNTWVRFEMTGEEIKYMFISLAYDTYYPYSGVIQTFHYRNSIYSVKNILLWDGEEEKPLIANKTYRVCTNDYLANGGDRMQYIRKWYKTLRNKKDFGIIREAFIKYLKNVKPITKEKFVDEDHPRLIVEY